MKRHNIYNNLELEMTIISPSYSNAIRCLKLIHHAFVIDLVIHYKRKIKEKGKKRKSLLSLGPHSITLDVQYILKL
jgi:hypothetical protein